MSVSIRSPIIAVVSEWASIAFSAERIISGFGLPTKYGSTPVARLISAATEPVAGSGPSGDGPVASGLVAMKRAPAAMSRIALRDPLEAVGARLAEHDVVRVAVGERVAGLMQRGGEARLADHERRPARPLVLEEPGGGQGRGPDRMLRTPRAR